MGYNKYFIARDQFRKRENIYKPENLFKNYSLSDGKKKRKNEAIN